MWFEQKGHHVQSTQNGEQALARIKEDKFDVLITDVNMPLMNGVDLVNAVLKLPCPPELIIILTSRCDDADLKKQFTSSRVHFYSKPFSPAFLSEAIEKLSVKQSVSR